MNYYLYSAMDKYGERHYFATDQGLKSEVKKDIAEYNSWQKLKLNTLRKEEFPKGEFQCNDISKDLTYIFFDGALILDWDDEAVCDYPEDINWNRDICRLVDQARRLQSMVEARKRGEI